jgi:two-component system response regulator NreC
MNKIRVLIADDHAILRAGLRLIINAQPDMEVVGEARTIREVVPACQAANPAVLIQDLNMPDGSGIAVIGRVRQECPRTRVLVLTVHDDLAYLRAALAAGAMGYVVKTAADLEFLSAIRAVSQDRLFVDLHFEPHFFPAAPAAAEGGRGGGTPLVDAALSRREREVLILLAEGHTNQQVADRLFLSVKTVETYRARIADKLGLRTRADIIRYAVEMGLLKPTPSDSIAPRTS